MKTIQSIDKAILVLNTVANQNGKLTLTDLSNLLNIKITTLHGILATLEHGKLLNKNQAGKYTLGVKLFEFGKVYEEDLSIVEIAHPYLEEMSERFNETLHLAIPFDKKILYIDKVESKHKFRLTSMVGTTEKAYISAIGLVILAYLPEKTRQDYFAGIDEFFSCHNPEAHLAGIFAQIKKEGFYIQYETQDDFYCIAVPILDSESNIVAAISIVVPSHRYNEAWSSKIVNELKAKSSIIHLNI